jgi:dipeptidase E
MPRCFGGVGSFFLLIQAVSRRRNTVTGRLLLISSSTVYGAGYLDHAAEEIRDFLGTARRVLFIPYALFDRDEYARRAEERLAALGYALDSAHREADPRSAIGSTDAIFVGGGNTFRLLDSLWRRNLIGVIRRRVEEGVPYVGSSAGSIVACPTLKTTKDMPIIEPPSFEALGLVKFQISPHYLDPDPASTHMGETQEERILQFHEENAPPVAGLREGAMLRIEEGSIKLAGIAGARIFRRGCAPSEAKPVADVTRLLETAS